MLDTIKVGIPLTKSQHKRIRQVTKKSDSYRWVLYQESTGEIFFRRVTGLSQTDSDSFHRELRWDVPTKWSEDCCLFIEFSIPKFWYRHNVHLLYDWYQALEHLRNMLNQQFSMKRIRLPPPVDWHLYRVDVCYAWRFPSDELAQLFLDSLKHLQFPWKKTIIYPTTILFPGTTYSAKLYLKHPEFRKHDLKEMQRLNFSLEEINHIEYLSIGVLRFEVTLRRKYLQRQSLNTVADLLQIIRQAVWDLDVSQSEGFDPHVALFILSCWQLRRPGQPELVIDPAAPEHPLEDGLKLWAPAGLYQIGDRLYSHPGGGCTISCQPTVQVILVDMLSKFVGKDPKMRTADEVKLVLFEAYSRSKAIRLISFWLHVQRFGIKQTKEDYSRRVFYRNKSDLKNAGISLLDETPLVTQVDQEFVRYFSLQIPSDHATNKYDDHRNSGNILNFVPKVSGRY